jgi:hypothetical protein
MHDATVARQILVEHLWSQNGDTPNLLAGLRHGAWLDEQDIAPLEYHVPGVIPEGFTLLVGPPKIGKSWLLLGLALALASGGKVLGLTVEARPVLYLALEDGHRRLQSRCRKLLGDDPIPSGFEYLTRTMPDTVLATITTWLNTLSSEDKPLVIVDTLGKVMPPALMGESGYGRDYRVGSTLKAIADGRPGSGLVVSHHDRKASADDFVDAVSGTHGLAGAADTIIVLARARQENSGLLKITGRDVSEAEYAVEFKSSSTWELAGHSLQAALQQAAQARATVGVGDRMAEIIGYVAARPSGVGPAEVAKGLSLERHAVSAYLGRAVEAGRLHKLARGLYAPLPTPVDHVDSVDSDGASTSEVNKDNGVNTPTGEPLDLLAEGFGDDIEEIPE